MHTLAICIPTYNRVESLKIALSHLEKQKFNSHIEVILSDNGSRDGTQVFVKKYQKTAPFKLTYLRNKTNLGFDQNILNLYTAAQTDYVWFLSDDDFILPKSLHRIWQLINKFHPTALHPNMLYQGKPVLKNGHFAQLTHYSYQIGRRLKVDSVMTLKTAAERMSLCRLLSFISCCVVKKDPLIVPKLKPFVGTFILQDAILSFSFEKKATVLISAKPSIEGGEKEYFSAWFMESLFSGIYKLYCQSQLSYPAELAQVIGHDCALFGLNIMSNPKNPVKYSLTVTKILTLLKTYRLKSISFLVPLLKISLNHLRFPERISTS